MSFRIGNKEQSIEAVKEAHSNNVEFQQLPDSVKALAEQVLNTVGNKKGHDVVFEVGGHLGNHAEGHSNFLEIRAAHFGQSREEEKAREAQRQSRKAHTGDDERKPQEDIKTQANEAPAKKKQG